MLKHREIKALLTRKQNRYWYQLNADLLDRLCKDLPTGRKRIFPNRSKRVANWGGTRSIWLILFVMKSTKLPKAK